MDDYELRFQVSHGPDVSSIKDRDELAHKTFDMCMEAMMEAKQQLSRNGPDDLSPKVIYIPERGNPVFIHPVAVGGNYEPDPPEMLAATLTVAWAEVGAPSLIAFCSEAWMKVFEEGEDVPADYQRGDFARDPKGVEVLSVCMVYRRGHGLRSLYQVQPFHYGDGTVIFDERPDIVEEALKEGEIGGRMTEIMRRAFMVEGLMN